ncbi:MAG: hypothetical protein L7R84_00685, partial [Balneolaceae bacterium]|nr:hypothetical protein [Balneolaceae bacterium]
IEASIRASKKSAQTTPSNPADHESPLNSSAYEDYRSNTLEHRNNKLIVSENSYNSFGSLKKAMHIDSASDSVFEQSNEISANIPKTWTPARTLSRVNKVHNPDKMAEIGAHASSVTR